MPDELHIRPTPRAKSAVRRVVALAEKQFGVINTVQLLHCGLSASGISRCVDRGWLYRVSRGVYAVGPPRLSPEGRLSAALLRAGSGAALGHMTAAWWWELLRYPPDRIHVCGRGRVSTTAGLRVHRPSRIDRRWHRGLPIVSVTQTLIQIAPICSFPALRRALAQADQEGWLDRVAIDRELARGPRGAVRLRQALQQHMPSLAEAESPLEERFLHLCERYGIPLPEPNVEVCGYVVDAFWRGAQLAVELDGRDTHGTPAAVVRDRRRELVLRRAGVEVLRYGSEQIDHQADLVAEDLNAALARGTT